MGRVTDHVSQPMTYRFLFDRVPRQDRPAPNIAEHQAEPYTPAWRQYSKRWPYSEPVGFYDHCLNHGVPVQAVTLAELGSDPAVYPIAVSFFDHTTDHLGLVPDTVCDLVRQGQIRIALFYTEGDDPSMIRDILTQQERSRDLPTTSTVLISANSQADSVINSMYFTDDELLFRHRNRWHPPVEPHLMPRSWAFTCLSRTHKWWRLATVAEMHRRGYLDHAQWSYNTELDCGDSILDCPISLDYYPGLRDYMTALFVTGPHRADGLTADAHNDHEHFVLEHYRDSYFQVILETHFDADGSGGTFITEKTFKAIKNCQPFVIFGPQGTLARLRDMGYSTFDDVIDNSYDLIPHNNERWEAVLYTINRLMEAPDLHGWYQYCIPDLVHNMRIFQGDMRPRLNRVLERLFDHASH